MGTPRSLAKFKVPLTAQEIELLQLGYEGGTMHQLRVRIRERARFTTLDLDPLTARRFGELLCGWARAEHPDIVGAFQGACAGPCEAEECDG